MRLLAVLFPLAVLADPCTRLCQIDGPRVCTDGSYNKNGVCHRYLFRGDPALNDYCYHTSATAATCPSSGKAVKLADAERLVGIREGRGQEVAAAREYAPPPPPDRLRREEPRVPTTTTTTTRRPTNVGERLSTLKAEVTRRVNPGLGYINGGFIQTDRDKALINSLPFLNGVVNNFVAYDIIISFNGEPGYGPGMTKEWLAEVTRQLFAPESGFFVLSDAAPLYYKINPRGLSQPRAAEIYRAAGRLLGLSLMRNIALGVNFPVMFYAKLLEQQLTLDEVSTEEQQLVKSMRFILSLPEEDLVDYPITIDGVEVVPTMANRADLVVRKVNSLITPDVVPMFNLIKRGFNEVVPSDRMRAYFGPAEFKALILGSPDIDIDDLFARSYIYMDDARQRAMLYRVLTGFNMEQRRKFLRFATNLSQAPVGGFSQIEPRITIRGGQHDLRDKMPKVFLCTHTLLLPDYKDEDEMREILTLSIEAGTGWK